MDERGQSLVEFAIIAPILILIFVGVLEVGYLLRDYMIVLNTSREAARFASKPIYAIQDEDSFLITAQHTKDVINPLVFDNAGLVITIVSVDTGWPCDPKERELPFVRMDGSIDYWPNCDCSLAVSNPYTPWITSTLSFTLSNIGTLWTEVDTLELVQKLGEENERLNCQGIHDSPNIMPSMLHEMVIAEVFYRHKFLGPWGEMPMILRAETKMRMYQDRE